MTLLQKTILAVCCVAASQLAAAADDAPLDAAAYGLAERAYAAIAAGDLPAAEQAADEALRLQPESRQLGLLHFDVLMRKGDLAAAQKSIDELCTRFAGDALVLVQRGYLAQRQQRHQAAMEDFLAALSRPGLNKEQQRNARLAWADSALLTHQPGVVLDALAPYAAEDDDIVRQRIAAARAELSQGSLGEAYRHLREGRDADAVQSFRRGFAVQRGASGQYADAAYAAKRVNDNASADEWFRRVLDTEPAPDKARAFGYRREIQEMNRNFGAVASLAYQNGGFGPANSVDVLQGGLEAYWQPEGWGYRNGKLFQAFVRAYQTLYDGSGGRVGPVTAQGSAGVRYKPLGDVSFVLTAERLFRIGDLALNDWLLRAGYSTGAGSDWNPVERDWPTWSVYTESAYFVGDARFIQNLEARYGHSWAVGADKWVAIPHLVLGGDYDNRAVQRAAFGWGPGITLRRWFREDVYQAPASWFDLTVQYRFELSQAPRARGLSLRATLWY
ncbi:MAG TPA: hypothetical protein VK149_00340 [Sideroxyarcus sp.]|nr:hypothetical protein [Sideroxyarcus sp.]